MDEEITFPEKIIDMEIPHMYSRHYITVDKQACITDGWSDGPRRDKCTDNAICISEHGGYCFRLLPNGEENPPLSDMRRIPLYKYINDQIIPRTQAEIDADYIPPPDIPNIDQRISDLEDAYTAMMFGGAV